MATGILLQDWITIRTANATPIIQIDSGWIDAEGFTDLVGYVETAEALATPTLALETSPSRDPSLFRVMSGASAAATSSNKYTWAVRFATAAEPMARFVRWSLTGAAAATASLTFRIWLSLNSQGGFVAPFPRIAGSMQGR